MDYATQFCASLVVMFGTHEKNHEASRDITDKSNIYIDSRDFDVL